LVLNHLRITSQSCSDGFTSSKYPIGNRLYRIVYKSNVCSSTPYFLANGNITADTANSRIIIGGDISTYGNILFPPFSNIFNQIVKFTVSFNLKVVCISGCGNGMAMIVGSYATLLNLQDTAYVQINTAGLSGFSTKFYHLAFQQAEIASNPNIGISCSNALTNSPTTLAVQNIVADTNGAQSRRMTFSYGQSKGASILYNRINTNELITLSSSSTTLQSHGFNQLSYDTSFLIGARSGPAESASHIIQNLVMPLDGYGFPTSQPSGAPTQPSSQPSSRPSDQPSRTPTNQPSKTPSRQPTAKPSRQPSSHPSFSPTAQPSGSPTKSPSAQPSLQPTSNPTSPTSQPSYQPTQQPIDNPTSQPTGSPTRQPSKRPSRQPSAKPSASPTRQPSTKPTSPTNH
jgi:hypothetical protein